MSVCFVDLGNAGRSLHLTNRRAERLIERGVFMPAGLFGVVDDAGRCGEENGVRHRTYFPSEDSPDASDLPHGSAAGANDNSLRVTSPGVARACGYAAVALRYAIRKGVENHREWVTPEDRALLEVLDEVIEFLRDCEGFEER